MSAFVGIFLGLREIFGKDEAAAFAVEAAGIGEDGGKGSGNFNHAGRPGKIGGSGGGSGSGSGGESEVARKIRGMDVPMRKTEAGIQNAAKYREKYSGLSSALLNSHFAMDFGSDLNDDLSSEQKKQVIDRLCEVLEFNGDMTPKDGKKVNWTLDMAFRTPKQREEYLKKLGFSDEEAQKTQKELSLYTEGDWKKADTSVLDDYIRKRKDCYGGALFRGMRMNKKEYNVLMEELKAGVVSFGKVASWSAIKDMAVDFSDKSRWDNAKPDDDHGVVFEVIRGGNRSGVPVTEFSRFYKEKEMLTASDTSWSVISVTPWIANGNNSSQKYTCVTLVERGAEYDQ